MAKFSVCGALVAVVTGFCCISVSTTTYRTLDWYAGDSCELPTQEFAMAPDSSCVGSTTCNSGGAYHDMSHYKTSCVEDFSSHAGDAFGSDPFVIFQYYDEDEACTTEEVIQGVRVYDGHCVVHNSSSSYSYEIRSTADVIEKWFDSANCSGDVATPLLYGAAVVLEDVCEDGTKVYIKAGVYESAQSYIADTIYADSTCSTPHGVIFTPQQAGEDVQAISSCSSTQGVYYTRAITQDYQTFAAATFGATPYVVEETFYDVQCTVDMKVSAVRADGTCFPDEDQTSMAFFLGESSLSVKMYLTTDCSGGISLEYTVSASALQDATCVDDVKPLGAKYYAFGAPTTAPATETPTSTPASAATETSATSRSTTLLALVSIAAAILV